MEEIGEIILCENTLLIMTKSAESRLTNCVLMHNEYTTIKRGASLIY